MMGREAVCGITPAGAKRGLVLEVPGGAKRVLLHTCCAPCSSAIIEIMLQQGITPTVFYSNSNIFPQEEYLHRKDECTRYAQSLGLEIVDDDYEHADWRSRAALGLENEPERGARCLACFKYRLLRAARYASQHGFTVLTTTLASSRWKDLAQVDAAGRWACDTVNASLLTSSVPGDSPASSPGSLSTASSPGASPISPGKLSAEPSPHGVSPISPVPEPSPFSVPEASPITSVPEPSPFSTPGASPITPTPVVVTWWGQNWRKGGLQDRRNQLILELDFYNQQYCGCEYSLRDR